MMVRKRFLPWLHHVSLTHKHWTRVVLIRSPGGHLCWTWSVDCCLLGAHLGRLVDNICQWGSGVSISELYLQCLHSVDTAEDFDDERCQMPFLGPQRRWQYSAFCPGLEASRQLWRQGDQSMSGCVENHTGSLKACQKIGNGHITVNEHPFEHLWKNASEGYSPVIFSFLWVGLPGFKDW